MRPRGVLIGNQWREGAQRVAVHNPFTGELIGEVPLGDAAALEAAIGAAESAFAKVRALPGHRRASLLLAIAQGIGQRREHFVQTIVGEAGKPVVFAEAEVDRAMATFSVAAEEARRVQGELLSLDGMPQGDGHFGLVRRFPIGVIAAITPFNFPLNLVAHKIAPCLASGNTMVLKPAPQAPLTALLLAEVLVEAGMPAGQVNVVPCSVEDAARLIDDERVKMISFTGSAAVGWQLKARCGRKRIALELGGNAAVIVHSDANLAAAVPAIATGAFGLAGQSCVSVQRVLVHESLFAEFQHQLVGEVKARIRTGDPRERTTIVGPLIDRRACDRVARQLAEALAGGTRLVHGGQWQGPCLEATILKDLDPNSEWATQEAFAPVVILESYQDFDHALSRVNATPYGLQAGVFTRDLSLAMRAFERLEVGGVLINQVPTWRVESMPYGGIKESGFGREGLHSAIEEMTELKSLIIRL